MVMYVPQRGSPEYYSSEEIGQPDESSEVGFTPIESELVRRAGPPPWEEPRVIPPREELQKLPKTILLRIAIELDPDTVASSYQEG